MVSLAPWAIGAVDAWAQLDTGRVHRPPDDRGDTVRRPINPGAAARLRPEPGAGLPGDAGAGAGDPDAPRRLEHLGPLDALLAIGARARRRSTCCEGHSGLPVSPPATTLSQDPDASLGTAVQLAGGLARVSRGCWGWAPGLSAVFGLVTVINGTLMTLFAIVQALTWNGKIYGIRATMRW